MLTHVVVWKYRTDIDMDVREEHVTLLRNLSSVIPQVQRSFSWLRYASPAALLRYQAGCGLRRSRGTGRLYDSS
jgi:hypothetical protein